MSVRCGCSRRRGRSTRTHPETLWQRQEEIDGGQRAGVTPDAAEEIKRLKKENAELRRANEILKFPSVFFAKELDVPLPLNYSLDSLWAYTASSVWTPNRRGAQVRRAAGSRGTFASLPPKQHLVSSGQRHSALMSRAVRDEDALGRERFRLPFGG
ncbi:hypothetical protein ACFOYW_06215 [Gryllotalpicola reticulitermitis]|uniref:Transposase n=1 Tax=Gryllotalpicola reticulitermitis TaxID=1184153 RepID=A0ABV8Q564_9MICO